MFRTWNWNQVSQYAASKLIGSGVLYLVTILIIEGFHFDNWAETAKVPYFWMVYYGYAIFISVLIDFLIRKTIPEDKILYKLPLYFLGGMLPFIVLGGFNGFAVFAGLFGMVGACIYYGVSNYAYHACRLWPYSGVMSVLMTLFLVVLFFL